MKSIRRQMRQDDRGIALVMAMGVALIGISVAAIVVTQVIVASNDSGRDRVRTTEVHSAEGAADATMAELERAAPCPGPSFSPLTYGNGSQATEVTVEIDYYNDSGLLTCSDTSGSAGTLSGVPNKAVVTATSVAVRPGLGIAPVRKVQSELKLTPNVSNGVTAAIFASGGFSDGTNISVIPSVAGETADVWLDSGSWSCKGNIGGGGGVTIQGGLYIPDGTLTVSKVGCDLQGDVWVQHGVTLDPGITLGGSLTVRDGALAHSDFTVHGDVLVGGADAGSGTIAADGTVKFNVGASSIPNLSPVGLPKIEYVEADWTKEGFTAKPLSSFNGGSCTVSSAVTLGGTKANPQKQVYDLRGCNPLDLKNNTEFLICEDTAIFTGGLASASSYKINSCNGQPHKLWMIVPYTPSTGTMELNKGTPYFEDLLISSFWYAPETVNIQPHAFFQGQIYGGNLILKNKGEYNYVNVGVPGVDLAEGTSFSSGFSVELTSKREVS